MSYDEFIIKQKDLLDKAKKLFECDNLRGSCLVMDALVELQDDFIKEYVLNKS